MSTSPSVSSDRENRSQVSREALARVLNDPARWSILTELARSGPLMVKELAVRLHRPATTVSKHMAVLRSAKVVEIGQAGLYFVPAHFLSEDKRHLDFGHCLLKISDAAESPGT